MNTKAIIYCRVSSEKQVKEGHGLDGQELRCRQYAKAKGYEVTAVFRDEGISGGVADRPGMRKLLSYLETAAVFEEKIVVIIDDISRIARDIGAHFQLRSSIKSRNGVLESPSIEFEESPMGKFVETVMAGGAELARNENRVRVMKNMRSRMEKGYWSFDEIPGYKYQKDDIHGKVLRRDEPKASVIQEALEGFSNHRFETKVDVQKFLESKKYSHRAAFKGVVHLSQVIRLLERAYFYAGFIEYPFWDISRRSGHHDAIIDLNTLKKIEERLKEKERRTFRKDLNEDFPLRGFLACAHCEKLMTASWSRGRTKQYALYRCTQNGCQFQNKSIRKRDAEERMFGLLQRMVPKEGTIKLVEAVLRDLWDQRIDLLQEQKNERQKHAKSIDQEIDNLCERLADIKSPILIQKLESRVDQLEAKKRSLDVKQLSKEDSQCDFGTALTMACNFMRNPAALWNSDVFEDKRTALNLAFIGILPYDKQSGFGTVTFALPFELCKACETEKSKMVEMPGVEPGCSVYEEGSYDHVLFNSL